MQADPDGAIQQVVLVHGENALQLGVFAAPRTEGIWDEVRAEIRKSLFDDGVAAEEVDGEYGVELRARVRTPEGLTDIRFVGVDGPRWMVRGVYQGPAAVDPADGRAAGRVPARPRRRPGQEAKPVREPLAAAAAPGGRRAGREAAQRRAGGGDAGRSGLPDEATRINGATPGGPPPRWYPPAQAVAPAAPPLARPSSRLAWAGGAGGSPPGLTRGRPVGVRWTGRPALPARAGARRGG